MWRLRRKMITLGRLVSTRALAKRPMRGKSLSWAARQRRTNSTTTSYRKNGPMAARGSQPAMPPRNMRRVNSGKKLVAIRVAASRAASTMASIRTRWTSLRMISRRNSLA